MTFDEWFHKEYEPADLQIKQYVERKEGLHIPATCYLEDLKKAFEAGFHSDVHTDNSKVIAELEEKLVNADYQLEGRDLKIKELEDENERLKGDLELWESGACRAINLDKCGVVKELEAQKKELQCCANCRHSYGGEEEPHHDCGYCHAMQCICKLKLEEHTSDIYRMWEDKCDKWEMRVN